MVILVAGPYRSGTNDDPARMVANVHAMRVVCLELLRAGHLGVTGEDVALPLIELAGSARVGDAVWDEIFHPVGRILAAHCDGVLRIGGPSRGADEMIDVARANGKRVFYAISEIETG